MSPFQIINMYNWLYTFEWNQYLRPGCDELGCVIDAFCNLYNQVLDSRVVFCDRSFKCKM